MAHLLVRQVFPDFDQWFVAFKANAPMRRDYGSTGALVFRNPGNPNEALIYFTWDSVENLNRYLADPRLIELLDSVDAGVPLVLNEPYEVEA